MAGVHESEGTAAAPSRLRADGRRNSDRIVRAASRQIAEHGASASLEEIARQAKVGSATLHRHFPSRRALLEAVFYDQVVSLCAEAGRLSEAATPFRALVEWLEVVTRHGITTRGLTTAYLQGSGEDVSINARSASCEQLLAGAGDRLLSAAQQDGLVRRDLHITDLLNIVFGLCVAAGNNDHPVDDAIRLLHVALEGVAPATPVAGGDEGRFCRLPHLPGAASLPAATGPPVTTQRAGREGSLQAAPLPTRGLADQSPEPATAVRRTRRCCPWRRCRSRRCRPCR